VGATVSGAPARASRSTPAAERAPGPEQLEQAARATRERAWDPASDDLTTARNAHHSNTPAEMLEALEGDHDWLEGDLRVDDAGTLVMAHDSDQEASGLTLEQWLAVGAAGERGMKVDVKEDAAIPELLDALEASGIPDGRLMINVQAGQVDEATVRAMRERFPDAWLALNPRSREGRGYAAQDLREVTDLADAAGGRVAFPIRWDIASDEAIQTLEAHGKVSIWTSAAQGTPDDRDAETRALRERGVEGVIDLGDPQTRWQRVQERLLDIWESDQVRGARDVLRTGWDVAGTTIEIADSVRRAVPTSVPDAVHTGIDVASDAWDIGTDIADGIRSRIPGL
jgi:glycerophosphoryl diester phosphodiesterase